MDPFSLFGSAAAGAGALMQGAAALVSAWRDGDKREMSSVALRGDNTVGDLTTTDQIVYLVDQPTAQATIRFTPADESTEVLLDAETPVMIIVSYGDSPEPIDIAISSLAAGFTFGVVDGTYKVDAQVLDPDALEAEEISAIASGSIAFYVDGPVDPFAIDLEIAIPNADELVNVVIDQYQCHALTSRGYRCLNLISDDTVVLCGLHLGRLKKGHDVFECKEGLPFEQPK